jgi:hypothetical protein
MEFNRSLIFPPKLITGYVVSGTTVAIDYYSGPGEYNGFAYRWMVTLEVSPQSHSNPNTPTPYTYNSADIFVGMWIGLINGTTYKITQINDVIGLDTIELTLEDTDLLNLLSSPDQTGSNTPLENSPLLIFNLDDEGTPILTPIQTQSSQLPGFEYWITDIQSRFNFRNYYKKYFYISPGFNNTGLTGGDPVYLTVDSTFAKVNSDDAASVNKLFGFVSGSNLPSPGNLTILPSGKYVTDLPNLPGATGDILYLDTNDGVNNLTNIYPATGPVKPVYIKISTDSALMITSGNGGGGSGASSLAVYDPSGNQVTAGATGIQFLGSGVASVIAAGDFVSITLSSTSGSSGTSGLSGSDGTSGTSGIDGTSGTSGTSGTDGISGTSRTTCP